MQATKHLCLELWALAPAEPKWVRPTASASSIIPCAKSEVLQDMSAACSNKWILQAPPQRMAAAAACPRLPLRPVPHLSLVCFSPAGSGGTMFLSWQEELPDEVEVLAVELPGRSSRLREPPISDMAQLMR